MPALLENRQPFPAVKTRKLIDRQTLNMKPATNHSNACSTTLEGVRVSDRMSAADYLRQLHWSHTVIAFEMLTRVDGDPGSSG